MNPDVQKILITVPAIFVSAYLGYRFGLHSERVREYNELAARLFLYVDAGGGVYSNTDDVRLIRRRMSWLKKRQFDRALARYAAAAADITRGSMMDDRFTNPEAVDEARKGIVKCLRRK